MLYLTDTGEIEMDRRSIDSYQVAIESNKSLPGKRNSLCYFSCPADSITFFNIC